MRRRADDREPRTQDAWLCARPQAQRMRFAREHARPDQVGGAVAVVVGKYLNQIRKLALTCPSQNPAAPRGCQTHATRPASPLRPQERGRASDCGAAESKLHCAAPDRRKHARHGRQLACRSRQCVQPGTPHAVPGCQLFRPLHEPRAGQCSHEQGGAFGSAGHVMEPACMQQKPSFTTISLFSALSGCAIKHVAAHCNRKHLRGGQAGGGCAADSDRVDCHC